MRGAIPPLPNMSSWRGAPLKHRDNFNFTFYLSLTSHRHFGRSGSLFENSISISTSRHVCYRSGPSEPPRFNHHNNIWGRGGIAHII
jgi:hypothetical protein